MNIHWHTIAAWAFGFFVPAAMAGIVGGGIGLIALWWQMPEYFHLSTDDAWCGGWLFVACAIVTGIVCSRII